ncbi:Ribulose-phosphate 3-epimerase [Candidatus Johnevansia muelleri]|uniref:Ribulose-phosphate 3-epimerase n=1 Tax=Candidatus Johnevansia muelleri TaxID=1495769 RepID=A0A078KE31_9GAMM|nr:Ribulose-phosphate 3-epimerase [Candidatus Evansia muelleri]
MQKTLHCLKLAPSILAADFAKLGKEVEDVILSGADIVHFDVMDNHYVPNISFGPMVCKSIYMYMQKTGIIAPIDVHLMVSPVDDRIITEFINAGAKYITFHPEASLHIDRSISLIKDGGCEAGLAFNPATPLSYLKYVLYKVDLILIMSVNPGFSGNSFIPSTIKKIAEVRNIIDKSGYKILIEVDGGIKTSNINKVAQTGTDICVVGSAIFSAHNNTDKHGYDSILCALRKNSLRI